MQYLLGTRGHGDVGAGSDNLCLYAVDIVLANDIGSGRRDPDIAGYTDDGVTIAVGNAIAGWKVSHRTAG